jgi:hypothetical protein
MVQNLPGNWETCGNFNSVYPLCHMLQAPGISSVTAEPHRHLLGFLWTESAFALKLVVLVYSGITDIQPMSISTNTVPFQSIRHPRNTPDEIFISSPYFGNRDRVRISSGAAWYLNILTSFGPVCHEIYSGGMPLDPKQALYLGNIRI